MHDGLAARYIPDTEVVDEPLALPRVSTEELVAQISAFGVWHRRTPDLATTACGLPFHSQFSPVRREELTHPLCPDCFTKFELRRANERAERERP